MTRMSRAALVSAAMIAASSVSPASAQGIIDEWSQATAPAPPKLERVTLDPATTALLVLDLAEQTCNAKSRPRCVAMLPLVAKLLELAHGIASGSLYAEQYVAWDLVHAPRLAERVRLSAIGITE